MRKVAGAEPERQEKQPREHTPVAADGQMAGGGRKRERQETPSLAKPTHMSSSKEWTRLWRPDEKRHLAQLVEKEKIEHKNIQLGMNIQLSISLIARRYR